MSQAAPEKLNLIAKSNERVYCHMPRILCETLVFNACIQVIIMLSLTITAALPLHCGGPFTHKRRSYFCTHNACGTPFIASNGSTMTQFHWCIVTVWHQTPNKVFAREFDHLRNFNSSCGLPSVLHRYSHLDM